MFWYLTYLIVIVIVNLMCLIVMTKTYMIKNKIANGLSNLFLKCWYFTGYLGKENVSNMFVYMSQMKRT